MKQSTYAVVDSGRLTYDREFNSCCIYQKPRIFQSIKSGLDLEYNKTIENIYLCQSWFILTSGVIQFEFCHEITQHTNPITLF